MNTDSVAVYTVTAHTDSEAMYAGDVNAMYLIALPMEMGNNNKW